MQYMATVKEIATLVNQIAKQEYGIEDIVAEDLSNVVQISQKLGDYERTALISRKCADRIIEMKIRTFNYDGDKLKLLKENHAYGAMVEEIRFKPIEAIDSGSWSVQDKQSYANEEHTYYDPQYEVYFYNGSDTFRVAYSVSDVLMNTAFASATESVNFFNGLTSRVMNAFEDYLNKLEKRVLVNMIGQVLHKAIPTANYSEVSTIQAVNVLKLYKDQTGRGANLTPETCIFDEGFNQFESYILALYKDKLTADWSTLYNCNGDTVVSNPEDIHLVLISDYAKASDVFLASNVYHNELVKLKNYTTINSWQGTGKTDSLANRTDIHVNIKTGAETTAEIVCPHVIAFMFDDKACGVRKTDIKSNSNRTESREFTTFRVRAWMEYFNNLNENAVVFYNA